MQGAITRNSWQRPHFVISEFFSVMFYLSAVD
jgi:hypothetical protein